MKARLIFFFIFFNFWNFAQRSINDILKSPRLETPRLEVPENDRLTVLHSTFEKGTCSENGISRTGDLSILKVYYTYTKNKTNKKYNQLALDRKRLIKLEQYYPGIFQNPMIEWVLIEQTGFNKVSEGKRLFHGFILFHRPLDSEQSRKKELSDLDSIMKTPSLISQVSEMNDPVLNSNPSLSQTVSTTVTVTTEQVKNRKATRAFYSKGPYALYEHFQRYLTNSSGKSIYRNDSWVDVKVIIDRHGKVDSLIYSQSLIDGIKNRIENAFISMPSWNPKYLNGKAVSDTVNLSLRVSYNHAVNGMYLIDGAQPEFSAVELNISETNQDPFQQKILENVSKTPVYQGLEFIYELPPQALVMDVTGSMTLHIVSMLMWIKMHNEDQPFTSFTFFNDGDNRPTGLKPIGGAGGIYTTGLVAEIDQLVRTAMAAGYGGNEISENDLEGVLHAIEMDSKAKEVLLIGDNYSPVRDISLLDQVAIPVNVLLCAAEKSIRLEYLKIVKKTGGKLILNGTVHDFSDLQKGGVVKLNNLKYRFDGSDFFPKFDEEAMKP
jgi:hypothetical protein